MAGEEGEHIMANWIETIILIFIIISVIMTIFTEPTLSFKYFGAVSKSGIVLSKKGISFGINIVNSFTDKHVEINQTIGDKQLELKE